MTLHRMPLRSRTKGAPGGSESSRFCVRRSWAVGALGALVTCAAWVDWATLVTLVDLVALVAWRLGVTS